MPDIGLLQGPPRPKLSIVPKAVAQPAVEGVEPAVPQPPVMEMAPVEEAIKVAAHAAVVSERPLAEVTSGIVIEKPEAIAAASDVAPPPAMAALAPEIVAPAPVIAASVPVIAGPVPVFSAPTPAIAAAAPVSAAGEIPTPARDEPRFTPPDTPAPGYPLPPIRLRDLLWLLLALAIIIGTGLGIRDPWPADEPRFVSHRA